MVCQYQRRYLWLETSASPNQPMCLWERAKARKSPKPPNSHLGRGEKRCQRDHGRYWLWQCAIWGAVLAFALTAVTQASPAQEQGSLVGYRIINGAIPEPLTDQPGDVERGWRIVLDRDRGDCVICHAMPLPQRQFHGSIGPPLDGVGARYSAGELRLRLVDPKRLNPDTIMPAYHRVDGLQRVHERYRGKPILTAPQIEDVVAYLLTLQSP
jgi:L-cysteine S-thiosulfotransferase